MIDDDHMLPTHHINDDHETIYKQLTDEDKNLNQTMTIKHTHKLLIIKINNDPYQE